MGEHLNDRKKYFRELDSIRFLAFLFIFIHHTHRIELPVISGIQRVGWIGVDIFLCLSAFLLTRLLLIESQVTGKIALKKFYVRRILRIWPLYFAYLLLVLSITTVFDIMKESHHRFITLATFTDNIATAVHGYNPLPATSHLWTISYEEQFYLLLPFCVLLLIKLDTKGRVILLGIVTAMSVVARILFMNASEPHFQPAVWVLPITHFESITAGFLLAFFHEKVSGRLILFGMFSILSFSILLLLPFPENSYLHVFICYPVAAFFSFSVVALAVICNSKQSFFLAVMRYLGRISYGLYIFHLLCLTLVYHFKPFDNEFYNAFVALITCVILAALSFELFEKRFLKLKHRYSSLLETGRRQ
jgi:peptidoglycan/LPS O-acetylase OafA/YrhL